MYLTKLRPVVVTLGVTADRASAGCDQRNTKELHLSSGAGDILQSGERARLARLTALAMASHLPCSVRGRFAV